MSISMGSLFGKKKKKESWKDRLTASADYAEARRIIGGGTDDI